MFETKAVVLGVVIVMYALIILFQHKKAWTTLGAAAFILLLENLVIPGVAGPARVTPYEAFFHLVNWNVLCIYVGSLAIAELFIYSRIPSRIADNIVCASPGSGIAIVIILVITGIISAFVENVATVLVMAPIALALSKKINMVPTYFMAGLAVMSNLQGTATLVGDPPSMIFASFAKYGFNDFFFYDGRPSVFFFVQSGMIAGVVFFYFLFARNGKGRITVEKEKIVSLFPGVLFILMIVGLALCSFFLRRGISREAGLLVLFLGAAGLLWYWLVRREGPRKTWALVRGLDWETILFLIGIFVVVGALEKTGVLHDFAYMINDFVSGSVAGGFIVILLVSVVISGFVDNVPYIIAMLPVAHELSLALSVSPELYMFALLIGSCLGGNLTPFGASANMIAVGILKKEGIDLRFSGWLKIAVPFTLVTTTTAAVLLWLVWR